MARSTLPVTLMDVAKAAGVSHTTVSLVLRGKGNISDVRRKQILRLARTMGYAPYAAAQMLRARRRNHVGLVLVADFPYSTQNVLASPAVGTFVNECETRGQKLSRRVLFARDVSILSSSTSICRVLGGRHPHRRIYPTGIAAMVGKEIRPPLDLPG